MSSRSQLMPPPKTPPREVSVGSVAGDYDGSEVWQAGGPLSPGRGQGQEGIGDTVRRSGVELPRPQSGRGDRVTPVSLPAAIPHGDVDALSPPRIGARTRGSGDNESASQSNPRKPSAPSVRPHMDVFSESEWMGFQAGPGDRGVRKVAHNNVETPSPPPGDFAAGVVLLSSPQKSGVKLPRGNTSSFVPLQAAPVHPVGSSGLPPRTGGSGKAAVSTTTHSSSVATSLDAEDRRPASAGPAQPGKDGMDWPNLPDERVLDGVAKGVLASHNLEDVLQDKARAVRLRRQLLEMEISVFQKEAMHGVLDPLPWDNFNYEKVYGQCCENVIGYVPIPLGTAGPLMLDGERLRIPMATTEGSLVASTSRGCKAITKSGGARSYVLRDGMARAPVVRFPGVARAVELQRWLRTLENFKRVKNVFDSSSRFVRLVAIVPMLAGRNVYLRFVATTGDAMGMNMISKGSERALKFLELNFQDMEIVSLSGNVCTDKKSSAVNWIEGRGKSVIVEATIHKSVVAGVLKTKVEHLTDLNLQKNLVGSSLAGSLGGMNAHAANIVAAVYIACGQDPAQVVEGSQCMTLMERTEEDDLFITCTMPAIEVGTVGGGTILEAQSTCLDLLGVRGPCREEPGKHAQRLACIVAAAVMAGELSLMSALAAGHLLRAHLKHNRSSLDLHGSAMPEQQTLRVPEMHRDLSVMSFASAAAADPTL